MCQILFSRKNMKNIINLSSAESAQSTVSVKLLHLQCMSKYLGIRWLFHYFPQKYMFWEFNRNVPSDIDKMKYSMLGKTILLRTCWNIYLIFWFRNRLWHFFFGPDQGLASVKNMSWFLRRWPGLVRCSKWEIWEKYSWHSLAWPRLSRIPAYLEVKIWSLPKHENLTTGKKILWKRGEIAPKEQFLLFSTIFSIYL